MWYNDILLILMGVVAILMILMAVMIGSRAKKPTKKVEEEPQPEKIRVEKGFEHKNREESVEPEPEPEPDYSDYMKPETPEYEEPPIEETIEIEPVTVIEDEPIQEEPEPIPEESIFEEPVFEEPEHLHDESVEITPIEPIIIETEYEPDPEHPDIYGSPSLEEPDDDVIITPNQTFYDPVIEEPSVEPEIQDIQEIELPEIETESQDQVLEEIEPDTEEEPEELILPEETLETRSRNRIRKPIRDESDPEINMDLGVETCPHCGSKVPNTIYCINCGKALDPNNLPEPEEE